MLEETDLYENLNINRNSDFDIVNKFLGFQLEHRVSKQRTKDTRWRLIKIISITKLLKQLLQVKKKFQ